MNPLIFTDYYKTEHFNMYPKGTTKIYSNFTPRKSRVSGVDSVVFFGLQALLIRLNKEFNDNFFFKNFSEIEKELKRHIPTKISHIKSLHELGYLPLRIKALKEGTKSKIGVPVFTITNTNPDFYWLVNYLETHLSCEMWQPITSATIANQYRVLLEHYAKESSNDEWLVDFQAHDFSMRGMSSLSSAINSGMGHLTSFKGTDTIPAIYALEEFYGSKDLIGASVPATEHSVMCMGTKENEIDTFSRLLDLYPSGILSVVSDTWDLWKVLTEFLPALKSKILSRDGKLVIRPDSGDPVKIICGDSTSNNINEQKGVIQILWEIFGGTVNDKGYKVLDPHIGAIYGDSITLDRAEKILSNLLDEGFASTNVVFGVGSYTYQYNTRDTFGFAMKATYGEIDYEGQSIFKDPITDSGEKKSAKGLLSVVNGELKQECTKPEEEQGQLQLVYENGKIVFTQTLDEVRNRIKL